MSVRKLGTACPGQRHPGQRPWRPDVASPRSVSVPSYGGWLAGDVTCFLVDHLLLQRGHRPLCLTFEAELIPRAV
eukprot:1250181-Prymnesium_polylepis.1